MIGYILFATIQMGEIGVAKYYSPESEYSQISEKDYCIRSAIERIMQRYTIDMENYGYFQTNLGVPEDVYDDVAEDIMTELNLWEVDQ